MALCVKEHAVTRSAAPSLAVAPSWPLLSNQQRSAVSRAPAPRTTASDVALLPNEQSAAVTAAPAPTPTPWPQGLLHTRTLSSVRLPPSANSSGADAWPMPATPPPDTVTLESVRSPVVTSTWPEGTCRPPLQMWTRSPHRGTASGGERRPAALRMQLERLRKGAPQARERGSVAAARFFSRCAMHTSEGAVCDDAEQLTPAAAGVPPSDALNRTAVSGAAAKLYRGYGIAGQGSHRHPW